MGCNTQQLSTITGARTDGTTADYPVLVFAPMPTDRVTRFRVAVQVIGASSNMKFKVAATYGEDVEDESGGTWDSSPNTLTTSPASLTGTGFLYSGWITPGDKRWMLIQLLTANVSGSNVELGTVRAWLEIQ